MGAFSFLHMIIVCLLFLGLFVFPVWKILQRMGFPPALSLLIIVPFAPVIGLYVIAFSRWPAVDNKSDVF